MTAPILDPAVFAAALVAAFGWGAVVGAWLTRLFIARSARPVVTLYASEQHDDRLALETTPYRR